MRDVMAGLDSLIEDGLVDGDRMGVTGGSYGGYLTSWIVGHTDRFKAAVTCRSVNDLISQMLSGDIGGPVFGLFVYGVHPWEDWDLFHRHSPLTYATEVTTPLLIQHAEKDLRCTITQAEELFAVLRSLRKTVRLMRTQDETHELTRSGTPFRRVDNCGSSTSGSATSRRGEDADAEDQPEPRLAAARIRPSTTDLRGSPLAPLRGKPYRVGLRGRYTRG